MLPESILKKCVLFVPALGSFGPIFMVMGLGWWPSSDFDIFRTVIAGVGAVMTGFALSILGAVATRALHATDSGVDLER